MKPIGRMFLGELAAFARSHLEAHGINAVLSGGGCVVIYTDNRYKSYDLDFIENVPTRMERIREVLAEIGFMEKGRNYEHPETEFYVDFPAGPLAVGREPVRELEEMRFATGFLTLLSPTDCVKDRLAAFYHWNDLQCLKQALLVVGARVVDLEEIERWSAREDKLDEFKTIRDELYRTARDRKNSR